jgi:hypothetical protein
VLDAGSDGTNALVCPNLLAGSHHLVLDVIASGVLIVLTVGGAESVRRICQRQLQRPVVRNVPAARPAPSLLQTLSLPAGSGAMPLGAEAE